MLVVLLLQMDVPFLERWIILCIAGEGAVFCCSVTCFGACSSVSGRRNAVPLLLATALLVVSRSE